MSDIQALLFDKNYYNKRDIKEFIKRHNIVPCKEIHETKTYYRQRLLTPNYRKFKYRFHNIKTGLDAILQYNK